MKKYLKTGREIVRRLLSIYPKNRKYLTSKNIRYDNNFKNIRNIKDLPANITNQIIRKYGGNEKLKNITNMILPINTNLLRKK